MEAPEMADSLKTRVGRLVAGNLHALLDQLEAQSPAVMQQQLQREATAALDEVRHELGKASSARHLAQQQHARLNAEHERLRGQVDEALAALREDLAHAAVARQLDIEAQLPVLETQLAELARQEQELKGYLAALLAKQREMPDAPAPRADARLHELEALVREQAIAARLARIRAGEA
jgi:phage shock protein A